MLHSASLPAFAHEGHETRVDQILQNDQDNGA